MANRLFVGFLATLAMASTLIAGAGSKERFSAWQMLIEGNPAIADDASVDWRQRLILHLLTPRQAEEYFSGKATADELILADGRTLSAALQDQASSAGGLYMPLAVSCRLFESVAEEPASNFHSRERSFELTSANPSAQGGSASGCPIPQDAMAAVVQLRVQAAGVLPRIKLWAGGLPEPAAAVLEEGVEPVAADRTATTIVNLCGGPDCGPARLRMKSSRATAVEADLIGYFRPLSAADRIGAGPIFPLATEGGSNNFFGTGAGANTTGGSNSFFGGAAGGSNTTGFENSFFGRETGSFNTSGSFNSFFGRIAGINNTTGSFNSFFGVGVGVFNTTGGSNSFFGRSAGFSNTVEDDNTFIGAFSNGAAGVTNATALGHRAQVSQSDSLVLGSIAGVNEEFGVPHASVNVGIGTASPARQLHLAGSNATFRMDRDQNTAAFILVRTNSSGTPLKTFVVGTNASGDDNGEFIINDLAQEVGGPGQRRMTITNAGETHFTGTVRAPAFAQTSSLRYKSEVETLRHAVGLVSRLRGVSFTWKETGEPSLGLIAEEAAEVIPELVETNERTQQAEAINYAALTAVLVEAVKEQQAEIGSLRGQLKRLEILEAQIVQMESLLSELLGERGHRSQLVRAGDGR